MHDEAGVPDRPRLHLGVAGRGVVVRHQLQRQALGRLAVDQAQELQPQDVGYVDATQAGTAVFSVLRTKFNSAKNLQSGCCRPAD